MGAEGESQEGIEDDRAPTPLSVKLDGPHPSQSLLRLCLPVHTQWPHNLGPSYQPELRAACLQRGLGHKPGCCNERWSFFLSQHGLY